MDKKHPDEQALLSRALDAAQRLLGIQGKVLKSQLIDRSRQLDARVRLRRKGWAQTYEIEIKSALRPQILGLVTMKMEPHGSHALLVSDHVTPPIAERLREHGIQFIDTSGNVYLDSPGLYIWVKGEKAGVFQGRRPERGRAFTPSGLRVVLALLCRPEAIVREYRHIATLAGVAHGTVGWVIPDLQSAGFVASINGKRKLLHIDVLFDRWAEAYLRAMRPKLLWGRYRSAVPGWWKDASMARFGAVLGGEAAAARLTSHIRPSEVTLYTHRVEARLIAENGLRKDARGDVEILRRFWSFDASNEIAPLPVVYADLMGKGDARCMEAAKLIRERFLARSE